MEEFHRELLRTSNCQDFGLQVSLELDHNNQCCEIFACDRNISMLNFNSGSKYIELCRMIFRNEIVNTIEGGDK